VVGAAAATTDGVVGGAVGGEVVGATVCVGAGRLVVVGIVVEGAGARVVVGAAVVTRSVVSPPRAPSATPTASARASVSAAAAATRRRGTEVEDRPGTKRNARALGCSRVDSSSIPSETRLVTALRLVRAVPAALLLLVATPASARAAKVLGR
jgi:hypothetical protein